MLESVQKEESVALVSSSRLSDRDTWKMMTANNVSDKQGKQCLGK